MRVIRAFFVIAAWIALVAVGAGGIELYTRHTAGGRVHFFELDRLKLWNRRFYEEHRDYFGGWPIPLEFFDADKPSPMYLFKPNLRIAVKGNQLIPARPGDVVAWSSNSWGFRGPEFSVKKPSTVIRIVCLGASTTEGSQNDNQTYPHYLQQELIRVFPSQQFEVINAGHHAYDIEDLLALLETRVFPLDPDIVLFYESANNIEYSEFVPNLPCKLGSCWLQTPGWYRWLYVHIVAFKLLSDRLGWNNDTRLPPPMPHRFDEASPKPSAIRYRVGLSKIVRETLARKKVIVLSSFVSLANEGVAVAYAENPSVFNELYRKRYPLTPGELGKIYGYFNRESARVAAGFKVPYADVAAEFPREMRYFPFDIIHLSPEGNQLLARKFATFLAQNVLPAIITTQRPAPNVDEQRDHVRAGTKAGKVPR